MKRPFKQIECQWHGAVACIRLLRTQLDEHGLEELVRDFDQLIDEEGCKKLVLTLGPEDPLCLYSVFLAKLVNLQRRLAAGGGNLALAGLSINTQHIFQVTGLDKFFAFYADAGKAVEVLK
jgi:anti-anti-sigma factor